MHRRRFVATSRIPASAVAARTQSRASRRPSRVLTHSDFDDSTVSDRTPPLVGTRLDRAPEEIADQAFTDTRAASRISCESAWLSTARAMTIAPTNVAYVLIAFCLLAALDLPGISFVRSSRAERM